MRVGVLAPELETQRRLPRGPDGWSVVTPVQRTPEAKLVDVGEGLSEARGTKRGLFILDPGLAGANSIYAVRRKETQVLTVTTHSQHDRDDRGTCG